MDENLARIPIPPRNSSTKNIVCFTVCRLYVVQSKYSIQEEYKQQGRKKLLQKKKIVNASQ